MFPFIYCECIVDILCCWVCFQLLNRYCCWLPHPILTPNWKYNLLYMVHVFVIHCHEMKWLCAANCSWSINYKYLWGYLLNYIIWSENVHDITNTKWFSFYFWPFLYFIKRKEGFVDTLLSVGDKCAWWIWTQLSYTQQFIYQDFWQVFTCMLHEPVYTISVQVQLSVHIILWLLFSYLLLDNNNN